MMMRDVRLRARAVLIVPLLVISAVQLSGESLRDALAERRFDDALRMVEPLLKTTPGDPRLWTVRGIALAALKREEESLASFDRALEADPSFVPALKAASETAYNTRHSRALGYLQKLLQLEPASEPAHAMAGVLAFEGSDCRAAISHFENSRAQMESDQTASAQFGHCLIELGRTEQAVATFQRLFEASPMKPAARYNLALASLRHGQAAIAVQLLVPLVRADDADALNLLAAAQSAEGRIGEAIASLRRAAQRAPEDERNYLDLALLLQKHGNIGLAIEFLDGGLRRLLASARLYAMRGVLRAQLGDAENATADFEKSALLEPEETYASVGLSVLFSQTGRAESATKLLRENLKRSPADATLNYLLADALIREGAQPGTAAFAEAKAALKRSIDARPGFARAYGALGRLYLQEDNLDRAVGQLQIALRLDPSNRPALSQLITALRRLGRKEEAAEAAHRLRREYERDLDAAGRRGQVRIEKTQRQP